MWWWGVWYVWGEGWWGGEWGGKGHNMQGSTGSGVVVLVVEAAGSQFVCLLDINNSSCQLVGQ